MKKLDGYLDASGQIESAGDKALIVTAFLSTPYYWQEFDKEWLKILIEEKIPIKGNQQRPLFV